MTRGSFPTALVFTLLITIIVGLLFTVNNLWAQIAARDRQAPQQPPLTRVSRSTVLENFVRADRHTLPVEQRDRPQKPLMLIHLRKTGGTSLCDAVVRNNQPPWVLPDIGVNWLNNNCNTEGYWFWFHAKVPNILPYSWCAEVYQREIVDRKAGVVFMEMPLHDQLPCTQFRTMIILRDPVSRVVSDLLEVGVESLEEAYRRYAQPVWQPPHQTKHLDKHDKFLVDNFYIRTLLGTRTYFSSQNISQSDLEVAHAQLMKFDWVLFTDDLDTSIQELNQQEGWTLALGEHKRARQKPEWTKDPTLLAYLTNKNQFDIQLYQLAKQAFGRKQGGSVHH